MYKKRFEEKDCMYYLIYSYYKRHNFIGTV